MVILFDRDPDWIKQSSNKKAEIEGIRDVLKQLGGGNGEISLLRARLGLLDPPNTELVNEFLSHINNVVDYRRERVKMKKRILKAVAAGLRDFENKR